MRPLPLSFIATANSVLKPRKTDGIDYSHNWGRMEVDLLGDAQIAIELDGDQHLDNPEAYRRDRRKDVLLQENGYQVLRFLCEDVGKRLDEVLDAIIRALSHRAQQQRHSLLATRRE